MKTRLGQVLGTLAIVGVALFLIVVNFSAVQTRYECPGTISRNGASETATLFVKVETYRWWVHLWADSDASFWYEIPSVTVGYFGDVIEVGDQLQIYEFQNKGIAGNFSTLSKALALKVPGGFFDGICKQIGA
jgi:hypothetical protein